MYYPYFRGKQFELITVRETAELMAEVNFVPIIEPVKAQLKGLERALDAVCEAGGASIVIVNPDCGDLVADGQKITELLNDKYLELDNISAGILLTENMSLNEALALYDAHRDHAPVLVHAGFIHAKDLVEALEADMATLDNVFIDGYSNVLYRKYFASSRKRILVRDGVERRKNADYAKRPIEYFSDLHLVYSDMGLDGFGDFLTVGHDYVEGGGPAYAVAIHLTFIDDDKDEQMFVQHFVSDRVDTPTDPAGKFIEALSKLVAELNKSNGKFTDTSAVIEFRDLHRRSHFPGLGQAKKLSMKHHLETLARYLR
ncbi:sce7725 family protein [Marivivens donghaensis]|uniref:Sce7725 family protein n=1 Tax=Marivivens donghaensis TaxID=1699413 RepID=A0ABX0VY57_9RHOB|nr:sce7725 family protein [Marivivens donghaensis]NIY71829.1 sce7725 family protein [Marivivens donghaensis]